ncbi:MAG: L-threonylcarbamoyladenylate synthase [Alphaproteobacteria bacterium]
MTTTSAEIRTADAAAIDHAARLIRDGKLVAFPTETVYGLGCDATNDRAVAAVFAAKDRPDFNPLIVHFADTDAAECEAVFNDRARALARALWPGPVTIVLPRRAGCRLSRLASAGLDTVAVRVPANDVAHALLKAAGVPVAAPSANRSGELSPTTAAHVAASLDGLPALILDGGATRIGLESTVIDLSGDRPALLRPGGVPRDAVEAIVGPLDLPAEDPAEAARKSPGRIARHYAPRTPIRINARRVELGEALLAFGPELPSGADNATVVMNLSPAGDIEEAAANLFAFLHRLDAAGAPAIACTPVPMNGLGAAINDRLARAAEPLPAAARRE